jgi:S-(hydroxymethyl)glutathione dehydrogenase/alcohol dehydrogenase
MHMRAAVLHECPGQLDVTEVAVAALGPREVLVRTVAAGLCHSDLHCMQGLLPVPVPNVLGHESAGVVAAVGSEVRSVAPGDHVVACTSAACGSCEWCTVGRPHLCTAPPRRAPELGPALEEHGRAVAQFAGIGGFAEEMLLPEQAVVRVSRDVPLDRAALVGCAVTTGLGAVFNTAEVRPGATVAVVGCGGIGLNIVQGAVIAGASRVIAVDVAQDKLDLACAFGATDAVDASAVDPVNAVRELTSGGVDHAFEALGRKVTAEQAFAMLRNRGLATIVGVLPAGTTIELPAMTLFGERRLQGCLMGSNRFHVDIPYYLDLYLQGRLKLDELISQRIALDEINDGYAELAAGDRLARSVITFE